MSADTQLLKGLSGPGLHPEAHNLVALPHHNDLVNGVDPLGLFLLGGLGLATGIAALGTATAGLIADGFGAAAGKNLDAPFKATKGAMKGMAGAAAINGGIASAAGLAEAAPAVAATAMQHPDKLAAGSKAVADFASNYIIDGPPEPSISGHIGPGAKAGYEWYKKNHRRRK